MNYSLRTAGHDAHINIVAVALSLSIAVLWIMIALS